MDSNSTQVYLLDACYVSTTVDNKEELLSVIQGVYFKQGIADKVGKRLVEQGMIIHYKVIGPLKVITCKTEGIERGVRIG